MRIAAGIAAAFVLVPQSAFAQPPRSPLRLQFRCEVPAFSGAMSQGGTRVRMTVVSDGLACWVSLFGVPDGRRNPATDVEVTEAPQHGNVAILVASARYIADRGYVGHDTFAIRGVARDADNVERPLNVRVDVDVRDAPFERTSTGVGSLVVAVLPIRVGNDVPAPRKTKDVRPAYPRDAVAARAQGVVVIDATIDSDGKVTDTHVARSVPYLDSAAVAAVRQWEFAPTLIDGRAVPVIMTVNVSFRTPETLETTTAAASTTAPSAGGAANASPPSAPAPRAARVDPDIEAAFEQLQRRQYDDAVKAFRLANDKRNQQCAVCYLGLARAFEALGAAKNVADACDKAMAVGGPIGADKAILVQAHQLKAVALQDLAQGNDPKRLREAEDELRAATAIDPSANYLHFNMGVVLLRQGRDAEGVAALREELSLRPDSPHAARARLMIANPRRARESFAPEFSVVTLDRELVDLNSLKGKVVLLDFWGTWCPPCVSAVPSLRSLQKRFAKDPFVLLSVSSDSDEAVVRAFVDKNKMAWPQYWDRERKVQQAFDVRAYPTYVVIDGEGIVRFRTTGGSTIAAAAIEDAIKKQLKAAAARAK